MTNTTPFTLDPATTVGSVTLGVADLAMMQAYYQEIIGLELLDSGGETAVLGINQTPIVQLESRPNGKQYKQAVGLYHLAILLPTRAALGQWLNHYIEKTGRMVGGAGDHFVSEALYLNDPEGNGLEIYRDRPRDTWEFEPDGTLVMGTVAVDIPAVIAAADPAPFEKMPSETTLGHVHLQANNIPATNKFYQDQIGFDYMVGMPTATFMSAGGYHHHLGANTWHSLNAQKPPAGSLGLINYTLILPTPSAKTALLDHLANSDVPIQSGEHGEVVIDPSGNEIVITN